MSTETGLSPTEGNPITGLASLNDKLYIVRAHGTVLEMYKLKTPLELLRVFAVAGLVDPYFTAACQQNNLLYIADKSSGRLYKVAVQASGAI